MGVHVIVSLTELPLPSLCDADLSCFLLHHMPVADGTAPSMVELQAAVNFVESQLNAGRNVAVPPSTFPHYVFVTLWPGTLRRRYRAHGNSARGAADKAPMPAC